MFHSSETLGDWTQRIIKEIAADEDEEVLHRHHDQHKTFGLKVAEELGEEVIDEGQLVNAEDEIADGGDEEEPPVGSERIGRVEQHANRATHQTKRKDLRNLERSISHLGEEVSGQ